MTELKSILAIAIFTFAAAPSPADNATRTETVYQGHVTLEIPITWHEIPEDLLELHSLYTTESSGGRIAELYQHGYRPGNPELDFSLPQSLIQIRESGRLSYRPFLHLPSPEEMQATGSALVDGLELDDAFFDRDRYLLRLTNILGLEREIRISVLSASFLTERGFFTLHCYTHTPQTTVVAPIFERVVDSVCIDDELRYRPRLGDLWPPRPSTVAFAAAAVSLVILIILDLHRRRRGRS
jgi:hypothetical protein